MVDVGWIETLPSDGSRVGLGARDLRDMHNKIATGMNESRGWPGGEIHQGAAKAFVGARSASSFPVGSLATDWGKIFFDSDNSTVYLYTVTTKTTPSEVLSQQTHLVGTPRFMEHGTEPEGGFWYNSSGVSLVAHADVSDRQQYSFSSDGLGSGELVYDVPPQVQVMSDNTRILPVVSTITTGGFEAIMFDTGAGPTSTVTMRWHSSGTILDGR